MSNVHIFGAVACASLLWVTGARTRSRRSGALSRMKSARAHRGDPRWALFPSLKSSICPW